MFTSSRVCILGESAPFNHTPIGSRPNGKSDTLVDAAMADVVVANAWCYQCENGQSCNHEKLGGAKNSIWLIHELLFVKKKIFGFVFISCILLSGVMCIVNAWMVTIGRVFSTTSNTMAMSTHRQFQWISACWNQSMLAFRIMSESVKKKNNSTHTSNANEAREHIILTPFTVIIDTLHLITVHYFIQL